MSLKASRTVLVVFMSANYTGQRCLLWIHRIHELRILLAHAPQGIAAAHLLSTSYSHSYVTKTGKKETRWVKGKSKVVAEQHPGVDHY
uniref:SFRICE_009829 n=1 Tax=Spodoptera frugiperda TaxID=7108 RepID=A0A2H1WDJ5_SPOFR